jgi:hypothetical protein
MIFMTKRELCYTSANFSKLEFFVGFSLYNINFAERNSEAAIGGGGELIYFQGAA